MSFGLRGGAWPCPLGCGAFALRGEAWPCSFSGASNWAGAGTTAAAPHWSCRAGLGVAFPPSGSRLPETATCTCTTAPETATPTTTTPCCSNPAGPLPVRRGRLLGGGGCSARSQAPGGGQVSLGQPEGQPLLTLPCRSCCMCPCSAPLLCAHMLCRPSHSTSASPHCRLRTPHPASNCAGAPAWWAWRRADGPAPQACPHPQARLCRCGPCRCPNCCTRLFSGAVGGV